MSISVNGFGKLVNIKKKWGFSPVLIYCLIREAVSFSILATSCPTLTVLAKLSPRLLPHIPPSLPRPDLPIVVPPALYTPAPQLMLVQDICISFIYSTFRLR